MLLQIELCSHMFDVTFKRDRIIIMQIAINLYRLVLALNSQAPDHCQRALQGVPEFR